MNKYEAAFHETHSVLSEYLPGESRWHDIIARKVVERLVEKGLIQSTIENDLIDMRQ